MTRRILTGVDDRLKLGEIVGTSAAELWSGLQEQLDAAEHGKRHAVVFVHGYNVTFEGAAIRAAQIGVDLGIEAMAFFSWPSRGRFGAYIPDGEAIGMSELAITDFLVNFAHQLDCDAVHVIAHSMGNRGVLRAVERIRVSAHLRTGKKFSQFVLAAADVDADSFRALSHAYAAVAERTTLYVSSRDLALRFSRFLHDFSRIGFWPPVAIVPGIDTVSVSDVDVLSLGHGYVATLRPVLSDLHELLFTGLPPERRFSIKEAVTASNERYWTIKR